MGTRIITPAVAAQIAAQVKHIAVLMEGNFKDGVVRFWTGYGNITWDNKLWTGSGTLISIETIPETIEIAAQDVVISLSGCPPEVMAIALTQGGHNLNSTLWLAFLDANAAIIADPVQLYRGLLDVMEISETVDAPILRITYQNRLADIERPRLWNYTDSDQQKRFPGDTGFSHISNALNWSGKWGS
jgi:hypothetical protein